MCRRDDDRPVAILTKREARPPRDHGERALRFSEHFLQTGRADVGIWQILLQKSFWGDERNFSEPLMRFTSGDVRDHIVSSKIDQGPP